MEIFLGILLAIFLCPGVSILWYMLVNFIINKLLSKYEKRLAHYKVLVHTNKILKDQLQEQDS